MKKHFVLASALMAGALMQGVADPAHAQIRASERGAVQQTLDGTTISMDYARPSARGRHLFGTVVPWDVVWTPGANWATTLTTDRDVRINGVEVAAGAYSVWMTPRENEKWTMTLNPETELFHFQKPAPELGTYQIEIEPQPGNHVEMLTWSFPSVSGDYALLEMQWGSVRAPMMVLAEPTEPAVIAAEERAAFVGTYELDVVPGIGWPTEAELRVTEDDDGLLRGWMSFPVHPGDELDFDMVPAGRDRFHAGLYRDGRLFNVEVGVAFEFEVSDVAEAVILRGIEGSPFATGVRRDIAH